MVIGIDKLYTFIQIYYHLCKLLYHFDETLRQYKLCKFHIYSVNYYYFTLRIKYILIFYKIPKYREWGKGLTLVNHTIKKVILLYRFKNFFVDI